MCFTQHLKKRGIHCFSQQFKWKPITQNWVLLYLNRVRANVQEPARQLVCYQWATTDGLVVRLTKNCGFTWICSSQAAAYFCVFFSVCFFFLLLFHIVAHRGSLSSIVLTCANAAGWASWPLLLCIRFNFYWAIKKLLINNNCIYFKSNLSGDENIPSPSQPIYYDMPLVMQAMVIGRVRMRVYAACRFVYEKHFIYNLVYDACAVRARCPLWKHQSFVDRRCHSTVAQTERAHNTLPITHNILSSAPMHNEYNICVTFELTHYILIFRSKSVRLNELKSFN